MNRNQFTNKYLQTTPHGAELAAVMAAAVEAVDAENAVRLNLRLENEILSVGERRFDLCGIRRIFVVGAGKAGAAMAKAAHGVLGARIAAGFVIVKDGHADAANYGAIEIAEAAHPIPDERGVFAAKKLQNLVSDLTAEDLVVVLISGGGSSLTCLPVADIGLGDVRKLTAELLRCGATIAEINCLRKHLTELSGGGLARTIFPAQAVSLVISDVVGSPLDVIASGMTAPDTTTFADAWHIIKRYGLAKKLAPAVENHLRLGLQNEIADTPKDDNPIWRNFANFIIADNRAATEAAAQTAAEFGFDTKIVTNSLTGEAADIGKEIAVCARNIAKRNLAKPYLLIAGGETTVTLRGDGKGGRNQEMALGAATFLAGVENVTLATLATDGGDGVGDAAGAVVDGQSFRKARAIGFEPEDFLRRNDSYNFFDRLGALIRCGATRTNVCDLVFLLVTPEIQ